MRNPMNSSSVAFILEFAYLTVGDITIIGMIQPIIAKNYNDLDLSASRRLQLAHLVSCIIRGRTANINFVHNNHA